MANVDAMAGPTSGGCRARHARLRDPGLCEDLRGGVRVEQYDVMAADGVMRLSSFPPDLQ